MEKQKYSSFINFAILSGLIAFIYNAVMIIVPLRMADQGLNYGSIGGAMSAMAIGMLSIKLLVGRRSDIIGQKVFITCALFGIAIMTILLSFTKTVIGYTIFLCGIGFFRGIFTSVNMSYIFDIAEYSRYGQAHGNILGISSIFASLGGAISGFCYKFNQGESILLVLGMILIIAAISSIFILSNKAISNTKHISLRSAIRGINKRVIIFCLLTFIQSFSTSPMWNFIVPMYCYNILGFTAAKLGIVMSLDEIISSPTYIVAGKIVDKVKITRFNVIFLILTALAGFVLALIKSSILFIVFFLICSITIAFSFVGIPKERIPYLRRSHKGFELALISVCGSIGNTLGNTVLGKIADLYSMKWCIIIFIISYIIMALLLGFTSGYPKNESVNGERVHA